MTGHEYSACGGRLKLISTFLSNEMKSFICVTFGNLQMSVGLIKSAQKSTPTGLHRLFLQIELLIQNKKLLKS